MFGFDGVGDGHLFNGSMALQVWRRWTAVSSIPRWKDSAIDWALRQSNTFLVVAVVASKLFSSILVVFLV